MTKINKIIFLFLLGLGVTLRLWHLGVLPWAFFRDEAALGYNAYSIWTSGKDEFGVTLPLVFRSFEVFFLPLYVYISTPVVGFLGLSEFSSRFLSSLSGIAALFFVYLIGKKIWNNKVGIFTLLVLVISPWHIFYSRGAFEGNLALTLFTGGFYFWICFLKGKLSKHFYPPSRKILSEVEGMRAKSISLRRDSPPDEARGEDTASLSSWELHISLLLFSLSMYSYQAERLVVPLFALITISLVGKDLWKIRQKLIFPSIAIILVLIPLLFISFKAGGYHRAFGVSFFSKDEAPPGWIEGYGANFFVNNKMFLRGKQLLSLYTSYYSPRNLFFEGDFDKQRSVENNSVFYGFLLPFLIIGLASLLKKPKIEEKLLLTWMLLGPLPAAFTSDPFHTYRSLLFYMPITIIIGSGMYIVYKKLNVKWKYLYFAGITLAVIFNLTFFWYNYSILSQVTRAPYWDYGYKELVTYINQLKGDRKVIVDDAFTESYIQFLFFGKVNPETYQDEVAKLRSLAYYYKDPTEIRPNKIGNLEFRKIDWPKERGEKGTVFVFAKEQLPESEYKSDPKVELLKKIKYPDGTDAFTIVKIR